MKVPDIEPTTDSHSVASPAMSMRLNARAENVMLVRQAVEGAVRGLGAHPTVVDDIKLAVTEACSNVVKYAYEAGTGDMRIELTEDDDSFMVIVRDFGRWQEHDTSGGIEASGIGIPLMQAVTTSHQIDHGDDGTTVTLVFARMASADPRDMK